MLRSALENLDQPDLRLLRVSRIYETEPVGLPVEIKEQRWFLNLVAEFETDLTPRQLLRKTQETEQRYGRLRTLPNGPRTIDIDILLYGNSVIKTETLQIPHPRYTRRRFTLEPLAELNPALLDPVSGNPVAAMLASVMDQAVRPYEG